MDTALTPTRMLFMGDAALSDGFQLIGFETFTDPSLQELDRVLEELLTSQQNAFIILDHRLASSDSPMLRRVQVEGGRIIVTQVPPLNNPKDFHREIDGKLHSLLGGLDLDDSAEGT